MTGWLSGPSRMRAVPTKDRVLEVWCDDSDRCLLVLAERRAVGRGDQVDPAEVAIVWHVLESYKTSAGNRIQGHLECASLRDVVTVRCRHSKDRIVLDGRRMREEAAKIRHDARKLTLRVSDVTMR